MKVSAIGVEAIALREGCKLEAYKDERGIWTIGVGHASTSRTPPIPIEGMTITMAQALALLASDLAPIEAKMTAWITAPVSQNAFDACGSLAFNIGINGFHGSSVLRQLNARNYAEAAKDFLMWDEPADLLTRRQGEMAQFLRPDGLPVAVAATGTWSIQQIQTALNKWIAALGLTSPIAPLKVDGDWGPKTRSAVMEFQRTHGLDVDGVAGPLTIAALAAA